MNVETIKRAAVVAAWIGDDLPKCVKPALRLYKSGAAVETFERLDTVAPFETEADLLRWQAAALAVVGFEE